MKTTNETDCVFCEVRKDGKSVVFNIINENYRLYTCCYCKEENLQEK